MTAPAPSARSKPPSGPPGSLEAAQPALPSTKGATQAKLDWLDRVAADHERVNPTTFKVAFAVAQHLNGRTGEAWPSQERLAKMTGFSDTTLRSGLRTLVTLGHLQRGKRGVKNFNLYRLGEGDEQ